MRTCLHLLAASAAIALGSMFAASAEAQPPWGSDLTEYQRQYYESQYPREAFRDDLRFRRYQLRGVYPWGNYYPRTFYNGIRQYYYTTPYFDDPYYVPPYRGRVYYYRY